MHAAVGLGRHLGPLGYEVAYFGPDRWNSLPADTDILVALSRRAWT